MNVEMIIYVGTKPYATMNFDITNKELVDMFKENPQRFLSLRKKKLDELADSYQWSYAIVKLDGVVVGGIKAHRAPAVARVAA